jgi:uncharacterized protein (TIGR00251 family)
VIQYSKGSDALIFEVRVVPRASRSEIVGEHDGALRLRIAAPPVDGAANEAVIRTLALAFKVSRGAIQIISGHNSRLKKVKVTGVDPEALTALIQAA